MPPEAVKRKMGRGVGLVGAVVFFAACGGATAPSEPAAVVVPEAKAGAVRVAGGGVNSGTGTGTGAGTGTGIGGEFACPRGHLGRKCKGDEVCRIEQRGATIPSCVPNPCAGEPSCACAALCGPNATCSAHAHAPRQFTCAESTLAP